MLLTTNRRNGSPRLRSQTRHRPPTPCMRGHTCLGHRERLKPGLRYFIFIASSVNNLAWR